MKLNYKEFCIDHYQVIINKTITITDLNNNKSIKISKTYLKRKTAYINKLYIFNNKYTTNWLEDKNHLIILKINIIRFIRQETFRFERLNKQWQKLS